MFWTKGALVLRLLASLILLATFSAHAELAKPSPEKLQKLLREKAEKQLRNYAPNLCADALNMIGTDEMRRIIRRTSNKMKKTYPPKQFVMIGSGGSPAVLIADLQRSTKNYAFNFPFTVPSWGGDRFLPPVSEEELKAHMQQFLPSREVLGDRTIVMTDYAVSGGSLRIAIDLVQKFLKEKGWNNKVVPYFLADQFNYTDIVPGDGGGVLRLNEYLAHLIDNEYLKPISEYPSYIPGYTDRSTLVQNPQYLQMRESLGK